MNSQSFAHKPVLLNEVIEGLAIKADGIYIDCTYGRGGHSAMILQQLNEQGRLLAIDQDKQAIENGEERFKQDSRISLEHSSFLQLKSLAKNYGYYARANGVAR